VIVFRGETMLRLDYHVRKNNGSSHRATKPSVSAHASMREVISFMAGIWQFSEYLAILLEQSDHPEQPRPCARI